MAEILLKLELNTNQSTRQTQTKNSSCMADWHFSFQNQHKFMHDWLTFLFSETTMHAWLTNMSLFRTNKNACMTDSHFSFQNQQIFMHDWLTFLFSEPTNIHAWLTHISSFRTNKNSCMTGSHFSFQNQQKFMHDWLTFLFSEPTKLHAWLTHISLFRTNKTSCMTDSHFSFQNSCYTPQQLLAIYNANSGSGISKQKFMELCPSLIYQQVSGSCASSSAKNMTVNTSTAESKLLS